MPPGPMEFLAGVTEALDDPVEFLSLVSTMVTVFDARTDVLRQDDDGGGPDLLRQDDDGGGPDLPMFLESVIGYESPETTALLLALAELLRDNHLAQRARREARRRTHSLPTWLAKLEDAEPGESAASLDVLGDGENAIVSVRLAGGEWLTGVVYIDHNLGTVAKDGFIIPQPLGFFRAHFLQVNDDPEAVRFENVDPAETRSRIVQAIDRGARMVPPLETDTWPACRPLIEWMVGLLPSGGRGFVREPLTPAQRNRVVDTFLGSDHGVVLIGPDDADIVIDLLQFSADHTGGDPWRWSPWNIRQLLTDWYPRKVTADIRYLLRMPVVLRALVPYVHEQKGIPAHLTEMTLDAIDELEPVFLSHIAQDDADEPRFGRRLTGLSHDEFMAMLAQSHREHAIDVAGGEEAFAALDDAPLPDEPFAWEGIPEDIHQRVTTVLELCDGCADELFDVEMRTAFRRVLAQTARVDPAVFRRRSKDTTAAAAIAWAVGSVNNRVRPYSGGLTAKKLLAHFGVSGSMSQRAMPFLRAFGAGEYVSAHHLTFGTPDVLTSQRRRELIAVRDDAS